MARYRAVVTKILEDDTEVELVNVDDCGWYVSPVLKAIARQIYESRPPVNFEGQGDIMGELENG